MEIGQRLYLTGSNQALVDRIGAALRAEAAEITTLGILDARQVARRLQEALRAGGVPSPSAEWRTDEAVDVSNWLGDPVVLGRARLEKGARTPAPDPDAVQLQAVAEAAWGVRPKITAWRQRVGCDIERPTVVLWINRLAEGGKTILAVFNGESCPMGSRRVWLPGPLA